MKTLRNTLISAKFILAFVLAFSFGTIPALFAGIDGIVPDNNLPGDEGRVVIVIYMYQGTPAPGQPSDASYAGENSSLANTFNNDDTDNNLYVPQTAKSVEEANEIGEDWGANTDVYVVGHEGDNNHSTRVNGQSVDDSAFSKKIKDVEHCEKDGIKTMRDAWNKIKQKSHE